ncbi:hypothetical protein Drose_08735 [Dactylosporangium roseum]|uniref:DUF3558 domain-containing protein n=1 Tax=Dactylosporangium roseum TaxID=47989 RepID=A0ABY5Z9G6_9ACTN|nr:hypothetical protein [Dactylosporangium roseum]UWZ38314.1 hypothetical protein Drose_08735 [Dactylosporangium roseum]
MRMVLVAACCALLLGGCDGDAGAAPAAQRSTAPAAAAGGACQLLDFAMVNAKLGLDLNVAAAATQENTFTCVLQTQGASYPDLILSVSSTTVGADVFGSIVQPKDATAVPDLGLVGYEMPTPPVGDAGPGVEVGWLAGNKRIIELSLRFAPGTGDDKAAEAMPKVVELAKLIDLSSL